MFSCEFYEISKNTFFTEHLQAIASGPSLFLIKNICERLLLFWSDKHKGAIRTLSNNYESAFFAKMVHDIFLNTSLLYLTYPILSFFMMEVVII